MGTSPLYIKQLLASSVYFVDWYIILIKLFFLRFMIKCDKQGPRCHIWYHGRCVKISARRAKKIDRYICYYCKDTVYKEK